MRMFWVALLCAGMVGAVSCADDSQQTVEPATRSARGESCQARNDCQSGLACVNGTCSKNDFDVEVNSKHCDLVDCETDKDCCGDKPRNAPAKCSARQEVCTSTFADCTTTYCDSNSDCGDGSCLGYCTISGNRCGRNSDCYENVCVNNYCSYSGTYCLDDNNCVENSCEYKQCDCSNPDYDPSDPICTDPDCEDLCTLSCEGERCVPDTSCEDDVDCFGQSADICDDGRCVECLEDEDCNEDADETCERGVCQRPCKEDEECPLFHACEKGECVERGCGTDNECILALRSLDEPRLAKCVPSDSGEGISVCQVPCETDTECAQFEVCESGYCVFIGCKTHEECRAFFGLENEETDDNKPYITKAVCRD